MYAVTGLRRQPFDEPFVTLRDVLKYAVAHYGEHDAYVFRHDPEGDVQRKTYRALEHDIMAFGTGLRQRSQNPGQERIVTIGSNSYEWIVSANAALLGAGLSVPLDPQLPPSEALTLTVRARATLCVYHPNQAAIVRHLAAHNPAIRLFILMRETERVRLPQNDPRFVLFETVRREGETLMAQGERAFCDAQIDPKALASLIFTSGTTATSKGVMLSHSTIVANVIQMMRTLQLHDGEERALSVLPLHHTFENTVGVYGFWCHGVTIHFMDGLRHLAQNLVEYKITLIIAVPLLLENIHRKIRKNAQAAGKLRLIDTLIPVVRALRTIGIDIRRKVFRSLHEALGGSLWLCVVGAAALEPEIHHFMDGIGITCYAGYGLTECAPVVACCDPRHNRPGTVGQPLADVTVAIDDPHGRDLTHAGEILVRGDNVALGYYEDDESTAQTFQHPWLRTGDIGFIDHRDVLHVTGRKKSMIVLANGKKVFPEEIESVLQAHDIVVEAMVWGEPNARGDVDIAALIQVDPQQVSDEAALSSALNALLADTNASLPTFRRIKHHLYTTDPLIKTTTLKVRRHEQRAVIDRALAVAGPLAKQNGRRLQGDRLV